MFLMMRMAWILALPLGVCFFFYLKTSLATFGLFRKTWWCLVPLGAVSLVLGYFSTQMFSFAGVVLLHVIVACALCGAVSLLVQAILKKRASNALPKVKKLFGSGVLPILLTAVYLFGGYINFNTVVKTEYSVTTQKDIRAEGYRVALIADVHFGMSLNYEEMLEKCAEISAENPDMVILCGDIVDDDTTAEEMRQVFDALGTIESTYGTFYVHGNHDRPFAGRTDRFASEFTERDLLVAIESNGITILQDRVYQLTEDFLLVGREDRSQARRDSIEQLLAEVDHGDFILTLDHQPREYAQNGAAGTDLLLSGHTHGGHLFPLNLVMDVFHMNDAVNGHTQIDEDTQAIVTSGFAGWCYPVKTCAKSEYVIIDITKQ